MPSGSKKRAKQKAAKSPSSKGFEDLSSPKSDEATSPKGNEFPPVSGASSNDSQPEEAPVQNGNTEGTSKEEAQHEPLGVVDEKEVVLSEPPLSSVKRTGPTATGAPAPPPVETPAPPPVEILAPPPVETPAPPPAETPAPAAAETPAPAAAETPAPPPVKTPAPAAVETPAPTPVESPASTPVETSDPTPVKSPGATPNETPAPHTSELEKDITVAVAEAPSTLEVVESPSAPAEKLYVKEEVQTETKQVLEVKEEYPGETQDNKASPASVSGSVGERTNSSTPAEVYVKNQLTVVPAEPEAVSCSGLMCWLFFPRGVRPLAASNN